MTASMPILSWVNHRIAPDICHSSRFAFLAALLLPLCLPWPQGGLLLVPVGLCLWWLGVQRAGVYVCVGGLLAGYWGCLWADWQIPSECYRSEVAVAGQVVSFIRELPRPSGPPGQSFILELQGAVPGCGSPRRLAVFAAKDTPDLKPGNLLTLRGRLRPPPGQWSPGAIPEQARWLARGVHGRISVTDLQVVDAGVGPLSALRLRLAQGLAGLDGNRRSLGVLQALVLGEGGAIARTDWQRFRRLGISHAFVISGLHLGLVFIGSWWLNRRLFLCCCPLAVVHRDWAVVPAALLAFAYAALAGFSLPTQRALVMIVLAAGTRLLGWKTPGSHLLLVAALLIIATDYYAVLGSSFWMSVVATAGLLSVAALRAGPLSPINSNWLLKGLLIQLLLLLLMAPLNLFWFGQLSLAAIIANLVIVPLLSLLLIPLALLGTLITVLADAPDNAAWSMAQYAASWGLRGIEIVDRRVPDWAINRTSMTAPANADDPVLAVLDVAQGLAVVMQHSDQVWVYDTGDAPLQGRTQAEKILLPYLRKRGVRAVSLQIISHPDRDHAGGLGIVADRLPIARRLGSGGESCRAGQVLYDRDQVRLTVLNGPGLDNSSSCVLMWRYGQFRLLLAGDIDAHRERELIQYWREQVQADVLVVAHHGSNTSTSRSFLKWVKPGAGIISSGLANRFGHPHPAVLGRLRERGVEIFNTALSGTVRVFPESESAEIIALRSGNIPYWLGLP